MSKSTSIPKAPIQMGVSWIFKREPTQQEEDYCTQVAQEYVEFLLKIKGLP